MRKVFLILLAAILLVTFQGQFPSQAAAGTKAVNATWSLHTRVTSQTWGSLSPYVKKGDMFTGEGVSGVPASKSAFMIANLATLQDSLNHGLDLTKYSAINLDGEYTNSSQALAETIAIRKIATDNNKLFVAYYLITIVDAQPSIVQYPDIVVVGTAFWKSSNFVKKASPYVNLIRSAGRTPAIYVGDLKPGTNGKWIKKTQAEVDADISTITRAAPNGLGVNVISFFYEGQDTSLLVGALAKR